MNTKNINYEDNIGIKVSKNTIIGNILLSIIKVAAGILAKSGAMISDGVHSMSDVLTTIGVIIGLRLSSVPEDDKHQYGHERIESIASLLLAIVLLLVGVGIGWNGARNIAQKHYETPGILAIFAAILSIATKEWMYFYTMKYAKQINSASLKADAWHHRSDSLSSIGALIGIIGARMGYPILDPLVAFVIAILIIKVSYDIAKQSISQLVDEWAGKEIHDEVLETIKNVKGVESIDLIKTRQHATKIYVDVEITVANEISVKEGHDIAIKIHDMIESKNPNIKHCMVHVNPCNHEKH